MEKSNKVFIATSIDGYIADIDGGIDWLDAIPEINSIDTGYNEFMENVDALLMGRNTFETVSGFDIDWPYKKPVFVISHSLTELNGKFKNNAHLIKGSLEEILRQIHANGCNHLYIDGGKVIQSFLIDDLIDEMVITTIPVVLGDGIPLFSKISFPLNFECYRTEHFLGAVVQSYFRRKR